MRLEFVIPLKTGGGLNAREHWAVRARRAKHERQTALMFARSAIKTAAEPIRPPVFVELVRTKPYGKKMDGDGVQGSLKGIRDGIADAFGFDDGDESKLLWAYRQAQGEWGVLVLIRDAAEIA